MKYIAVFDVGTTAVKGALIREQAEVLIEKEIEIITYVEKNNKTQNPKQWYDAFCETSKMFWKSYMPQQVAGIVLSGQMQDLILINNENQPVCNAILYSDSRAVEEDRGNSQMIEKTRNICCDRK